MIKRLINISLILAILINAGCIENRNETIQRTIENVIEKIILNYYLECGRTIDLTKILICKTKPYKSGYLVLTQYNGEGPEMILWYITKGHSGNYCIQQQAYGDYPISMGFSANVLTNDSDTIIFGGLKTSTWVPLTDKRIMTDYYKIKLTFYDNSFLEEKIADQTGYIIITSKSEIDSIAFYNSQGAIINSLKDIENTIRQCAFKGKTAK